MLDWEIGEGCKQGFRDLVRACQTVVLRVVWTTGVQIKRFQRGIIHITGQKTILLVFWQSLWLLSVLCPKNLYEGKIKSFRLISRQINTDSVMWLLVIIHMQLHNENEQAGPKRNTKCSLRIK